MGKAEDKWPREAGGQDTWRANLGAPSSRKIDERAVIRVRYVIILACFSQIYIHTLMCSITLEP